MFTTKAWNKATNPTFRPRASEKCLSIGRAARAVLTAQIFHVQFLYKSFLTEINVRGSPSVRKREPNSCNKNIKLLR